MPPSRNSRKGKPRRRKDVRAALAKRTEALRRAARVARWEQLQRQMNTPSKPNADLQKELADLQRKATPDAKD